MIRWAIICLTITALLAPLAFSDLGRQFVVEAKLLFGLGLGAGAMLALAALARRTG